MILLDTNVLSEPLKPSPDTSVQAWIDAQHVSTLFLAAISLAELRHGIAILPEGQRKSALHSAVEQRVVPLFSGRILPFDEAAASAYASLRAQARLAGKGIGIADAYTAATALARGLTLATRDESPFIAAGLSVVNPWKSST